MVDGRRVLAATAIVLLVLSSSARAKEGRGERALRASFYLNVVPTLVEMVGEVKKDVLDALELAPKRRAVVEKALDETWTEQRLYANAAASLEKQLSPEVLDAALTRMTPEVQAAIKAGISETAQKDAAARLEAARKHPDAQAREVLARRIVAHMPQPDSMRELIAQVAEVLADAAQAATGSDGLRAELVKSLSGGVEPMIESLRNREALLIAALIAYREQPTARMKALADALDSDSGKQLQRAAIGSLLAGIKQTRRELVARVERELKPAKKK